MRIKPKLAIAEIKKPAQGGLHDVLGYFQTARNPIMGDTTTLQKKIRSYGCTYFYNKNTPPSAITNFTHNLNPIINTQSSNTFKLIRVVSNKWQAQSQSMCSNPQIITPYNIL